MKKNILVVWILGIISLSLIMFTFHMSSSAQPVLETKILVFDPFTEKCGLKSEFVVITRAQGGNCNIQADANKGRSNSYRCTVSTLTLDPCFSDHKVIACFVSPWNKRVVVIEPSQPLQKKPQTINPKQMPWAIELSDGHRCNFLAGEDNNIRDLRVNYACSKDLYVLGDLDQTKSLWYAKLYNSKTDSFTQSAILNAWY